VNRCAGLYRWHWLSLAVALLASCSAVEKSSAKGAAPTAPLVGFTYHWDFFSSPAEAERLLAFAFAHGAQVLNVVPPPHVWEHPEDLELLRRVFVLTQEHGVAVVLNRIDGSALAGATAERGNWLFENVLTEPGMLPSGAKTPGFFFATVGNEALVEWEREETAFYAEHFSSQPNLLAFSVGGFNEPFVSQRGSLLCWDESTESYELAQYTPRGRAVWRRFLEHKFSSTAAMNAAYGARFASLAEVPMPRSERDTAFPRPGPAYWDLVSAVNEWFVASLEDCQRIWHARRKRAVPFVLQLNGGVVEKLEKGRPAFAALDIPDWLHRADAMGLSLYLNCGYPDWGRASAAATISLLRLGTIEGKPELVLEGGNECDGATLEPDRLSCFGSAAAPLAPRTVIYEFLKEGYADSFSTATGKLLGSDWTPRLEACRTVESAFAAARVPVRSEAPLLVLDDVGALAENVDLQLERRQLVRLGLRRPVVFVPLGDVALLPPGTTLVVQGREAVTRLTASLKDRAVAVVSAGSVLGAGRAR
jgi:hypothetical protein